MTKEEDHKSGDAPSGFEEASSAEEFSSPEERPKIEERARRRIAARRSNGTYRELRHVGRQVIDFWSNDYLGLAAASRQPGYQEPGSAPRPGTAAGSTGSRLLSGNNKQAEAVEQHIAAFHGFDAGVLINSGYDANLGLLSCIVGRGDSILHDELAHASLIDGAQLSSAKRLHFRHNDLVDLEKKLQQANGAIAVVVEAIYSMDGDSPPLVEIAELCTTYGAGLIVDEAHSIGVIGPKGEGLVAALGLQDQVLACVYTFGKALGCHGAIITGPSWLKEYLLNFCRPLIYSTALAPAAVGHIKIQHQKMVEAVEQRAKLAVNIGLFREMAADLGISVLDSHTPIQGLLGTAEECKEWERALTSDGIAAKAILAPTVAVGAERVRICIHSGNSADEIAALQNSLSDGLRSSGAVES